MALIKRRLQDLAKLSDAELRRLFKRGTTPEPVELAGWELSGYAPILFARLAGFSKFKTGYYWRQSGSGTELWGYDVPVVQDGIHAPWVNKKGEDDPGRFGWCRVSTEEPDGAPRRHENALLMDYAPGENPLWTGARVLRSYVTQVDPDNPDLYVGVSYLVLGPLRWKAGYFIMERLRRSDFAG